MMMKRKKIPEKIRAVGRLVREPFRVILESQIDVKFQQQQQKTPTITGLHRSGLVIMRERKKEKFDDECYSSPHILDRGGNEMNISTSFICFHFILLYLLVFVEAPMSRIFCFYCFSPSDCHDALFDSSTCSRQIVSIHFMLRSRSLRCALYLPPTLQFNPSCADVSRIYRNYLLMLCVVAQEKKRKKKKKKRNETRRRSSDEKRRKRANRHNRWNL